MISIEKQLHDSEKGSKTSLKLFHSKRVNIVFSANINRQISDLSNLSDFGSPLHFFDDLTILQAIKLHKIFPNLYI